METLKKHQLDRNTLIIFTADQGLAGGHSGFWGMGDHTRPITAYDWTTWIPLIFWQPGRIAAGRELHEVVANYDVYPSLLRYLDLADQIPAKPRRPGRDFTPALRGEPLKDWKNEAFSEFENVRAIRTDRWKYIERTRRGPTELFDLTSDPGELHNLAGKAEYQQTQKQLQERLYAFYQQYSDPKWDLWHGGRSKARLITGDLFAPKEKKSN